MFLATKRKKLNTCDSHDSLFEPVSHRGRIKQPANHPRTSAPLSYIAALPASQWVDWGKRKDSVYLKPVVIF